MLGPVRGRRAISFVMTYSQGALQVSTAGEMFRSLLMSVRPKQWTKNLLVYLAVFFTINETWDPGDFGELVSVVGRATLP